MIENHSHGMFKIFEFLWIDDFDLIVLNFIIFNQRKQNISGESLNFKIEPFCHLALLQTLVNPPDMLPQG